MKTNIVEGIRDKLKFHETIVLFEEDDCHFGTVFHAAFKNKRGRVFTINNTGGGE